MFVYNHYCRQFYEGQSNENLIRIFFISYFIEQLMELQNITDDMVC